MQLFAFQDGPPPDADIRIAIFVIAIVIIALLFVGFFAWLIGRHLAKGREMAHLERMKALELGRAIGPSEGETCQRTYLHNVFWIAFWIGAVVPLSAASAASTVMVHAQLHEMGIILAIWICVAVISVASVVSATSLMISSRNWSATANKSEAKNDKVPQ